MTPLNDFQTSVQTVIRFVDGYRIPNGDWPPESVLTGLLNSLGELTEPSASDVVNAPRFSQICAELNEMAGLVSMLNSESRDASLPFLDQWLKRIVALLHDRDASPSEWTAIAAPIIDAIAAVNTRLRSIEHVIGDDNDRQSKEMSLLHGESERLRERLRGFESHLESRNDAWENLNRRMAVLEETLKSKYESDLNQLALENQRLQSAVGVSIEKTESSLKIVAQRALADSRALEEVRVALVEKIEQHAATILGRAETELKGREKDFSILRSALEQEKTSLKKLAEYAASGVLGDAFAKAAQDHRGARTLWRWIAGVTFVVWAAAASGTGVVKVIGAVIGIGQWPVVSFPDQPWGIVGRIVVTLPLVLFAAFSVRQAGLHNSAEQWLRLISLEFLTLLPLTSQMKEPEQTQVRRDIALKVFGDRSLLLAAGLSPKRQMKILRDIGEFTKSMKS